jgi:hypothetical protein
MKVKSAVRRRRLLGELGGLVKVGKTNVGGPGLMDPNLGGIARFLDPLDPMVEWLRDRGLFFDIRRVAVCSVTHHPDCGWETRTLGRDNMKTWCRCAPRVLLIPVVRR